MKLSDYLSEASVDLGDESQAQQLLQWLLDLSWSELMLNKEAEFPIAKEELFRSTMAKMKTGEPLAYIRGYQDFYKYRFKVTPSVLIPRPETELIVENCIDLVTLSKPKIFDLGTGSGCIGLSVARELPGSQLHLFDSSNEALIIAKENGQSLGVSNVTYHHAEIGTDELPLYHLRGNIDFVLANPPYIEVGDQRVSFSTHNFEPHEALYAKNNGLEWIHKWLTWSYDYLKPGGRAIFEFGDNQHDDVKKIIDQTDYKFEKFICDYADKKRFLLVIK